MMMQANLLTTQQAAQPQKAAKVTKVRRTRQPRNPQLSVARRNERERNRVKMVNTGFAILRDHLPVEDLAACEQTDGADTPDGTAKGKIKKYSKVETLRAAIQRIKMLEELIRSTEPAFESMNITCGSSGQSSATPTLNCDEEEPLSCSSAADARLYQPAPDYFETQQQQQQQQQHEFQQHQQLASPQNSQSSHSSSQQQQTAFALSQQQQQQHQQTTTTTTTTQVHQQTFQPQHSHTHLWLEQHQGSFMEQQQHFQHWQPAAAATTQVEPSEQQQQSQAWFSQQQQQHQHQSPPTRQHQLGHAPHQPLARFQHTPISPVWFSSDGGSPLDAQQRSSVGASEASAVAAQQPLAFGQHQISLYSQ